MYFFRHTLFLLLLVLVACNEPERISFTSDPRILRGTWVGIYQEGGTDYQEELGGQSVRLELSATYLNELQYEVTGTLQVNAETPLELEGIMHGGAYEIYTQAPPPLEPQCESARCYRYKSMNTHSL